MNLVELYQQQTTFPFHKILNWNLDVTTRREMIPIYAFGSAYPDMHARGPRTVTKEISISFMGLSGKEVRFLQRRMDEGVPIEDLKLNCPQGTVYLLKGFIKSLKPMDFMTGEHKGRFGIVIDCVDVAVNVDPPVSGFENNLSVGNRHMPLPQMRADLFRNEYMGIFQSTEDSMELIRTARDQERPMLDSLIRSARRVFGRRNREDSIV